MAIAPISSVSFRNNYNQVNFEGKKKEHKSSGMHIPSAVKAIPLATAIAMSPLTSVDASAQDLLNEDAITGSVLFEKGWDRGYLGSRADCSVYGVDTDGNRHTVEQIFLRHVFAPEFGDFDTKNVRENDGSISSCSLRGDDWLRVDTLEVNSESFDRTIGGGMWLNSYYAIGPGSRITNGFTTVGGTKVEEEYELKPRVRQKISRDLYNFIKDYMGNKIEYKGIDKNKK